MPHSTILYYGNAMQGSPIRKGFGITFSKKNQFLKIWFLYIIWQDRHIARRPVHKLCVLRGHSRKCKSTFWGTCFIAWMSFGQGGTLCVLEIITSVTFFRPCTIVVRDQDCLTLQTTTTTLTANQIIKYKA